jgi:hypothetical protein
LEPKKYDIFRRLSLRTIAILDVSPARILAESSVGRFTILASRSQLIVAALKGRALPKFSLGDKVATDWSDDWGGHYLDFGEVVGLCYLPPENTWIYYVNWTHTDCTDENIYNPNHYPIFFEGESEITDRLRLVNYV